MITLKLKEIGKFLSKKQVGIPLLVVATAFITATTVFALVGNDQTASNPVFKDSVKSTSNTLGAQTNDNTESNQSSDNSNNGTSVSNPKPGQATQPSQTPTPKKESPTQGPTTPKPTTPGPTTPTYPSASISFSSDGCYASITGTPGWTLSGVAEYLDEEGIPRKGGPLGDPERGYVIPASGSKTVSVGFAGHSWAGYRFQAQLADQSGAVKATKTVFFDSSVPACISD